MKKFTKFLVVALSLALLIGGIVGVTAYAEETETETEITYTEVDTLISSFNVSYAGKLHLCFAINYTQNDQTNTAFGKVQATVDGVTYDLAVEEEPITLPNGAKAWVVRGPGVAPKSILSPITVYAEVSGSYTNNSNAVQTFAYCDTDTYSVAEYFYERLYKNDVINATDEKGLAQKELYLATLAYAEAAQELLDPTAATVLDDMTYIWGDKSFGLVEKANALELDAKKYVLSYLNEDGSAAGSNVTGAAGFYSFDKITKITTALETIKAPTGAVTFGGFEANSKLDLNKAINTEGSVLIGSSRQAESIYDYEIRKQGDNASLYFSKYARSYIAGENAMHWLLFQNNSGVEHTAEQDLVFEARMRFSGNATVRIYDGRTAANPASGGTKLAEPSMYSTTGWFTLKIVFSGTTATIYVDGVEKTTATLSAVGADGVQITASSGQYFAAEFEYVYFGTEPATAATVTPATSDRAPDYLVFGKGETNTDIAQEGTKVVNESTFKDGYTGLKTETVDGVENTYMQMVKTLPKDGQPIYRIYDTTGATPTDTVVFEAKFRAVEVGGLSGIDMTLRASGTRAYRFYFTIGTDKSMKGGHFAVASDNNVVEGVNFSEWVTIRIEYTATGDAYDAETVVAKAYVNDVELEGVGASETVGSSCTYAKSSAIDSASIIFSGHNKGVVDMCDFYFGYKPAEAAE